ncbi:MAG: SDR family NAD(P)-dependent oxidoreductase, partial [Polyangiaceae bacterium]
TRIMSEKKVCAVIGIGPGNGEACARKFGAAGYAVALLSRKTDQSEILAKEIGNGSKAFVMDASEPESVAKAFASVKADLCAVDVVVYNAGAGAFGDLDATSAKDFEGAWRVNALGLFATAKEVVPAMKAKGSGAIVVIGASASRRGNVRTVAFAPAKAAQRSLCESLARTYWPSGIHVALIIVDGVIDLPRTRQNMKDKPDEFFVKPADIATTALAIVDQPRSTWSFEVEARPFGETW